MERDLILNELDSTGYRWFGLFAVRYNIFFSVSLKTMYVCELANKKTAKKQNKILTLTSPLRTQVY